MNKQTVTLDEHEIRRVICEAAHKKNPEIIKSQGSMTVKVTSGRDILVATVWMKDTAK